MSSSIGSALRALSATFERLFGTTVPSGPSGVFAVTALLGSTGNGMFAASAVLFFTRAVDVSARQASVALAIAGAAAIAGNAIVGSVADRLPPLTSMLALCGFRGVLYATLAIVGSFTILLPVLCIALVLDLVNQPIKQTLMRDVLAPDDRRQAFALQQSVINMAFAGGAAAAGVVISLRSDLGLRLLIFTNALLFIPMALAYSRLRGVHAETADQADAEPEEAEATAGARRSPWRDGRYFTFSASSGVLTISDAVTFFALPLWISTHTRAPLWAVSGVLILNTAIIATTQARWAKVVVGLRRGGLALGIAGGLLGCACMAFWAASHAAAVGAVAWVLAGGIILSVAEALYLSASWEVSVELAPKGQHAHYFSMTAGFTALSEMLGPLIITMLILPTPAIGWTVLGVIFATAGVVGRLAVPRNTPVAAT